MTSKKSQSSSNSLRLRKQGRKKRYLNQIVQNQSLDTIPKKFKTEKEFIKYHKTGWIDPEAYTSLTGKGGMDWLTIESHPIIVKEIILDNIPIEFRKTGEKLKYVRTDAKGEIMRDAEGELIHLTEKEIIEKNLPLYDLSIVAFTKEGKALGFASDEWGATGVWVLDEFQKKGLGLELLTEFHKQVPASKKMGQMTYAGEKLTGAYFRKLQSSKES